MGAVWLARDEVLLRLVAIKQFTIPEETLDSAGARRRALEEARAASQVTHPGVVRVYDIAREDEQPWIVMEALSGPTLAHAIRRDGRLPVMRVVDIGLQLLEALSAIHHEGILHRDVKPSNVQLSETGCVVLTDFGLATHCDAAPAEEAEPVYGSPPYMAPEALRERRFGPASDMFSLGATLYAAVEGRQAFDDGAPFSTLVGVEREAPIPPRHAGPLRPVIDGLLTKDPDQRMDATMARSYLEAIKSELTGHSAGADEAATDREGADLPVLVSATWSGLDRPPVPEPAATVPTNMAEVMYRSEASAA
jgi:serine/threonine protein kinase